MAQPTNIIDPHSVFPNGQNVDISNLTMFAELKVTKRNRSAGGNASLSTVVINFLGVGSKGVFTTDFTNNTENFGISRIEYKMTASYVPQVDIEFIDVRGQSLFNDEVKSPYRVLFDMPPPIFQLTLKGYYGQAVTYDLHLIHQNVSLNENASFIVKSSFVGMTFAPLADILLDYLEVAPYMSSATIANATNGAVNTTLELRKAAKDLVNDIKTATQQDVQYLQDKSAILDDLKNFQNVNYVDYFLKQINNINQNAGQNNSVLAQKTSSSKDIVTVSFKWNVALQEYANEDAWDSVYRQVEKTRQFFSDSQVPITIPTIPATTADFNLDTSTYTTDQYLKIFTIDFTNVNQLIAQSRNTHSGDIAKKQQDTKAKVKTMAYRQIQGGPTLKNVLGIILNDAHSFVKQLQQVVISAAKNRKGQVGNTGESWAYPFPIFFTQKGVNNKVRTIPTDESWDEVQFVNRYINAKNKAVLFEQVSSTNFDAQNVSNYVPINPFDGLLGTQDNIYATATKDNIYDIIVQRGAVLANATFQMNSGTDQPSGAVSNATELIRIYGQMEAYNIINTLQYKPDLMSMLMNDIGATGFEFSAQTSSSLFAADVFAKDTVSAVTNATVGVTYQGGTLFAIKSKEDFTNLGGIPVERTATNGTNDITNSIQTLLNNLTSAVSHNWLKRKISGDEKVTICQQNIPFFKDNGIVDGSGAFNNNSDFINGHEIFAFQSQLTDFSADGILSAIASSPYATIYSPFQIHQFSEMGAIHEVPFFVLAWWGYQCLHNAPQYNTIPQGMINLLEQKYSDFSQYVNTVSVQATIKQYLGDMSGLDVKRPSNSSKTDNTDFAQTDFIKKFSEIYYLILGENDIFYINPANPDKTINFAAVTIQQAFYTSLKNELKTQRTNIDKQQQDQQKKINASIHDNDLRTELYYGFKSFVDRWLLDTVIDFDSLLSVDDSFLTVDRAFNDIGVDLMVDLEPLYSDQTSVDTSLYTLLLNILTKNNMEFFSMPTYINQNATNSAIKMFGTSQNVPIGTNPKFICMYVGGTSAQLDMPKNLVPDATSHDNDGGDFGSMPDLAGNNLVQAFLVNMGTQNQSFFNKIELDQAEFKETNESIKLLDSITKSGDANNQTTETKSNNLYNVYQQRSYTATVHGLGNMMIQPTMYFQLDNISMWKGAYMIIEVNHVISPNTMETKFKGVRVPLYMKPYVNDYTLIVGLDLGSPQTDNNVYGSASSISGGRGITPAEIKDIKSSLPQIGNNTTTSLTNREKALLDVISYTEGTLGQGQNGYDVLYSSKYIQAWNPNYKQGHGGDAWKNTANGITSTAAGRYQFLYDTWIGYSTGTGTTQGDPTNKPFSLLNQDLTGVRLIKEKRLQPYGLDIEQITHDNFIHYIDVLALEWASFPFYGTIPVKSKSPSWSVGKGFYNGQGGRYTVDELWVVYSLALSKYTNGSSADLTTELNQLVAGTITPAQAAHIAQLHPAVQDKFTTLVSQIQTQTGYMVNITDSYRTYAQAVALKAQDSRNATPGTSLHEYGLAIDINLIKGNQQLYKTSASSDWIATGVVSIANNLGFGWGGNFPNYADNVHFEILDGSARYSGSNLLTQAQNLFGANLSQSDLRKVSLA